MVIRGSNDDEAVDFARLTREHGYDVRFIEYMPLDAEQSWERGKVVPAEETRAAVAAVFPLTPVAADGLQLASVFRFTDGVPGSIGFIPSVTQPFCVSCNRMRITSEGQFRVCLFALEERDLRGALRAGADDAELERLVREALWHKWPGHKINHPDFVRPARSMSMIGG
ncbi:hypothetical protein ACFZB9_19740 [Kitasatospora sp. NPDC008050]|uniref:hypothetical protein n=1 Tax=Kitasatospora sp. NPDC008050 TaxID=3364021 RepID=UPI0036EB2607